LLQARKTPSTRESFSKRTFDFTLALIGLILSSPLWLIVALAIYFEDRGPVLFRQERCGRQGKPFKMLKFRTMRHVPAGKHKVISPEDDPRVTGVGRLLRASALDELPNLVNILKGDMSFVGPKPLPLKIEVPGSPYADITRVPGYETRSSVRPGLTGIAQVYAPKDIDHEAKFKYDDLYVEKMNFWLDLKLIFVSFWITFRGKWEHRGKKV
jgi:lipopolysaccharide/colanic/teichoic acid biosynthesis glycosyltransferase